MEKSVIVSRLSSNIKYLGTGGHVVNKHPLKCLTCGHKWSAQLNNVFNGSGCPACASAKRRVHPNCAKDDSTYRSEVKSLYGSKYKPIAPYIDAKTPILHRCSVGHEVERKPNYVLSGAMQPCLTCSYIERTQLRVIPVTEYEARLKKRGGFKLTGEWHGVRAKSEHQCLTCNHVWFVAPYSLLAGQGCPVCAKNNANYARYRVKQHKLGRRIVNVQGYEPQALDWIVKTKMVQPKSIQFDVPRIKYELEGKQRLHIPDFWIPERKLVFEVKSLRTIGLWYEPLFDQIKAKRRAAIDQGYDYHVLLFTTTKKLVLPKNWWTLSHRNFCKGIKNANPSAAK